MLTKVRKNLFYIDNIVIFNNKVQSIFYINKLNKSMIIIKINAKPPKISWFQIREFIKADNCNIIFLLA